MDTLLRWIAEWKCRRRSAQVIVFDAGPEVERTRSFLRGAAVGAGGVLLALLLVAPISPDRAVVEEARDRERLLREAEGRVFQAMAVADACLSTAQVMEKTLRGYRDVVESYPGVIGRR